jgi:glycopeptide antibiotics resistance protein
MREIIMNDILTAFRQYAPYAIVTGIFIMFAICLWKSLISKETISRTVLRNGKKLILIYVFYIYCFIVVSITYFSREFGSRDGVDLELFRTCSRNLLENRYPIENIILFIPFGFLLPVLGDRFYLARWCLGVGLLFSMAIEVSQYLTKRGYFQTDDMITNLLGTLIGYIGVLLLRWLLIKVARWSGKGEEHA